MRLRLIWFTLPYPAAAQSGPGCHYLVYSMSSVCDGHALVSTEDRGTKKNIVHANMFLFSFPRHRARSDSLLLG